MRKQTSSRGVDRSINQYHLLGNNWACLAKFKMNIKFHMEIPLLGIYPKDIFTHGQNGVYKLASLQ